MTHAFVESTGRWERYILLLISNRINKDMSVRVMDRCTEESTVLELGRLL